MSLVQVHSIFHYNSRFLKLKKRCSLDLYIFLFIYYAYGSFGEVHLKRCENFIPTFVIFLARVYNRCRYRLLVIKNGENLTENDVEMASKFREKYPQSKIIIFFYSRASDIFKSTAISLFASKSDLPTLKTDLERSVRLTLFNLKNSFFYSSSLLKKMFIVTFLPEI